MNKLLAAFAFIVMSGFVGILLFAVPSPDLIVIGLLTMGLVAYDLFTSVDRKE